MKSKESSTSEAERDNPYKVEKVSPYNSERDKGEQVEEMFDSIAPAYDFMNGAMTLGLHRYWRDRALKLVELLSPTPLSVLDIATGTGDVAYALARRFPQARITGVDISRKMLDIARKKLWKLPEETACRIRFESGDSLALRFNNNSFDIATVAYGVRNFEKLRSGLCEIRRVLRPEGVLCIIELSRPEKPLWRKIYDFYSRRIIPFAGKLVSRDSRAYTYLPESIAAAPQREAMADILRECGFRDITWRSLTFGAATYYIAKK